MQMVKTYLSGIQGIAVIATAPATIEDLIQIVKHENSNAVIIEQSTAIQGSMERLPAIARDTNIKVVEVSPHKQYVTGSTLVPGPARTDARFYGRAVTAVEPVYIMEVRMKDLSKVSQPFVFEPGLKRGGVSEIVWLTKTTASARLHSPTTAGQEEKNEI